MGNFIQVTIFCPPEPRVDGFVYRNTGKVYRIGRHLKDGRYVFKPIGSFQSYPIAVNNIEHPARKPVACVLCCLPLKNKKPNK